MGGTKCIVDVYVTKSSEGCTERLDVISCRGHLLSLIILSLPFLFSMEAEVFKENDRPWLGKVGGKYGGKGREVVGRWEG